LASHAADNPVDNGRSSPLSHAAKIDWTKPSMPAALLLDGARRQRQARIRDEIEVLSERAVTDQASRFLERQMAPSRAEQMVGRPNWVCHGQSRDCRISVASSNALRICPTTNW
jgi:hypothetical protein